MSKKCIAVIEDEEDIIKVLTFNLEQEGYDVVSTSSGGNALSFVRKNKPDLVILDVMIPERDGFEVCKLLNQILGQC